jgi:hypothetical protein
MAFEDSMIDGQIGEQMYIDYLTEKNIKFIDVRDDELCQWLDIDFIIPQGEHNKEDILKDIRKAKPIDRTYRQMNVGYTVEVKLDKVTHNRYINKNGVLTEGTGNIVYEIISHNMPGCLARSYADFILYICVDTFEETTIFKKAYMINLYKWREAIVNTGKDNTQKLLLKSLKYVTEQNKTVEENIVNILHPIENLMKVDGVIKDFTENLKKYFPNSLHMSK